ncbi:hypothetical protein Q4581_21115 [Bacillus thuringiensis]|nr:hypothetical protein [Bacillus thuringiensis]
MTLRSGHKAIIKYNLKKMVYSGTPDLKEHLKISFKDKELDE